VCCARPDEQLFDWQNGAFLLFFPLMLLISTLIFRLTFTALGAKALGEVMDNVGELNHDTPMPYYPRQQRPAPALVPVSMVPVLSEQVPVPLETTMPYYTPMPYHPRQQRPAPALVLDEFVLGSRFGFALGSSPASMVPVLSEQVPVPFQTAPPPLVPSHAYLPVASTAIDRRNTSVMVSIGGFIYSIGLICWASIADFALPGSESEKFAQGFLTQGLRQGVEQVCRHPSAHA
jgi:hypothetical protein